MSVANGPVPMSSLALSGTSHVAQACTWNRTIGNLAPGDQLTCGAAGTVVITDSTLQVLLHSGRFA